MGKTFGSHRRVINNVPHTVKKILPLLLAMYLLSCNAQPCSQLPQTFKSYSQAISLVQKTAFNVKESANTSGSSWISFVKYYSCDGATSYLIVKTDKGGEYIHRGVPMEVCNEFKNAESKGSFYNSHIKHKFRLTLN